MWAISKLAHCKLYRAIFDVTTFSGVVIRAISSGHFFESYNDILLEVLDKHSTEEKNKNQPLGSGLSTHIKKDKEFFKIAEVLHARNEFRLEHNQNVSQQPIFSFDMYCNNTVKFFNLYKNYLPRLDGNRIYKSLYHQRYIEDNKFN